jgi:hypothetical protein
MGADDYNLLGLFCACNLGFEIRAGFVLHLVVLSVDFVAGFDEGGFQEIGCGGESAVSFW